MDDNDAAVAARAWLGAAARRSAVRRAAAELPQTPEELQACLEAAGAALLGLRVRGAWPVGLRSAMPEVVRTFEEAYGWMPLAVEDLPPPVPDPAAIALMDRAFEWILLIPLDPPRRGFAELHSPHGGAVRRRLLWARAMVDPRTSRHLFSWRRIARMLGSNKDTVGQWHARALGEVLGALHGKPIAGPGISPGIAKPRPTKHRREGPI